ncbi:O-antigen ligase family protein [Flavobacterium sp.]|uniref:O-antigen ligase family protein n=1 Tax=Flavobacterium sp. TaxID=239 RepID=UPI002602454A|nr:O-antigen ligase family protein [Flavobacterium sp.]
MDKVAQIDLLDKNVVPKTHFSFMVRDNTYFVLVLLMIFSYFYNLPVISYSIKGDNEFRLYDIVGVFIMFVFVANFKFFYYIITKVKVFKWFFYFALWCTLTILVTLFFSIFKDNINAFIQSVLYLFHLWVFFVTALMFFIISFNRNKLNIFVLFILVLSVISSILIIMQNFGFVPFLWNATYKAGYAGFLSGTLGPNKIITGMYSLMMAAFAIGLLNNKKSGINKLFLIFVVFINLYVLLLSGSRTSYVGLIIFFAFFAFFKTSRFVFFATLAGFVFAFLIVTNDTLYSKIDDVISNRVVSKVENEEDLQNANVGKLYEDLGAGRDNISIGYIKFILNNPEIIPFGLGFNNRLTRAIAAHNMYLTTIKELGIVGFVLYFGWLIQYLLIPFKKYGGNELAIKGLALSMLVTLYFGEHLYIYRPLFATLGMFLLVMTALMSYLHDNEVDTKNTN